MRILLTNPDGGAFKYIMRGFALAFEHVGHIVHPWDGKAQTWYDFGPDIYIGSSGWPQSIPRDNDVRIVLHVNPYGSIKLQPTSSGPDINEKPSTIEWVVRQEPDLLFGYGLGGDINQYWDLWLNEKHIPICGVPTAGDHLSYHQVPPHGHYACDLAFIGGYWKYKAVNIEKYLEPARKKFKTKIFGWGGWDGRSSGAIADNDVPSLLSSAKIGPCIHEPHTAIYGIDIPERVFKVSLCGAMAISDPSASLHHYFPPNIMPIGNTPDEYVSLIQHYLAHDDERLKLAGEQRRHVLHHHTYLHRIKTIFSGLGMIEECVKIQREMDKL